MFSFFLKVISLLIQHISLGRVFDHFGPSTATNLSAILVIVLVTKIEYCQNFLVCIFSEPG